MLPLLPNSAYTRNQEFVKQEWNALFGPHASTPASKVIGGWKGVLYANLALVNPKASWEFFASPHFDYSWIDGGASRTWYLAFAAGKFLTFLDFLSRFWTKLTRCRFGWSSLGSIFFPLFLAGIF